MKKCLMALLMALCFSGCQHKSIDNNQNKNFDHLAGIDSLNKVAVFLCLMSDDFDSIVNLTVDNKSMYTGKFVSGYKSGEFKNLMMVAYLNRTEESRKYYTSVGNSDTTFNFILPKNDSVMIISWYADKFHASVESGRKNWRLE